MTALVDLDSSSLSEDKTFLAQVQHLHSRTFRRGWNQDRKHNYYYYHLLIICKFVLFVKVGTSQKWNKTFFKKSESRYSVLLPLWNIFFCVHSFVPTHPTTYLPTYIPVWPDWAIYWTLNKFLKPLATINLPKSLTLLGNFCKGVKINHFSNEIIFGQLLQTFGNFFLVTLLHTYLPIKPLLEVVGIFD